MSNNTIKSPYNISVLMGDRSNAFWTDMDRYYRQFAPEYDMTINPVHGNPERDPEAQATAMDDIISRKPDGIIINPITNRNLVDGITNANRLAIPVFDVGAKTDQSLVSGMETTYFPVTTVDFYQQGQLGGQHIAVKLGNIKSGRIAIIKGRLNSAQSIGRSAGAIDVLAGTPGIDIIEPEPADFEPEKAFRISLQLLKTEPGILGFFCANDQMALAVARAAEEIDKTHNCIIVGVDGITEVRNAIREGRMSATVAFSTSDVAHVILSKVRSVLTKQPLACEGSVESRLLTRDNITGEA